MEFWNIWRGIAFLEIPFAMVRLLDCLLLEGYSNTLNVMLLIKNIAFTLFGILVFGS